MGQRERLLHHWPAMVRAAHGVLGNRDDAEECAAVALADACERPPMGVDNLEAFMVTVTKRRAVDLQRSEQRLRRRQASYAATAPVSVTDLAEDVVQQAEARWVDQTARELLKPQVYQLLRHVADGASIPSAAEHLGMTTRAAEGHMRRARAAVLKALAKTLVPILGIAAVIRRGGRRGVALVPAAAAGVAAMFLPFWSTPSAVGAGPASVPHTRSGSSGALTVATRPRASVTFVLREHRAGYSAPATSSSVPARRNIVRVNEIGRAHTTVSEGDTGGSEQGPVAAVEACLQDFQVNANEIGCSG